MGCAEYNIIQTRPHNHERRLVGGRGFFRQRPCQHQINASAIEFLHQARIPVRVEDEWRPLDEELLDMVREYLALYGRKP